MKNIDGLSAFAFTSSFISSVLGEIVTTSELDSEAPFAAHWTGKVLDVVADNDSEYTYVCKLSLSEKGKLTMWVCDFMIDNKAMYALMGYAKYHDIEMEE